MRQILAAIAAICIMAGPAASGETAQLEIIGFSEDGGIFAFEEFGIQDGSGFSYANRYYIDTVEDRFVEGSPIRVLAEEVNATVEDARNMARDQAAEIFDDDELMSNKGYTAGFNAVTEISADPLRIEVNPRPVFPPIDDPLEIRLEEVHFPMPELCEGLAERHVGFRLLKVSHEPDLATTLLHEDSAIPSSRTCPLGYRIGAIQTFFPEEAEPVFVVLIAVRRVGFEGPDHRWIAVPGRL